MVGIYCFAQQINIIGKGQKLIYYVQIQFVLKFLDLPNGVLQSFYEYEICAIQEYYAAYCGNSLSTFRDNLSVPFSRVKKSRIMYLGRWISWPLKMGPTGCPETSVRNYHYTLRNITDECRSHLFGGTTLKPRYFEYFMRSNWLSGAWGGVVVKALRY